MVYVFFLSYTVLRPNITDITITPSPSDNNILLHQFNETVSLTCTAEGGPRIMTRWQFDNGSSVETVANGSDSVTYNVPSLSTTHTGVYYCGAIIDGMTDTSMDYTLYGEYLLITVTLVVLVAINIVVYTFSYTNCIHQFSLCVHPQTIHKIKGELPIKPLLLLFSFFIYIYMVLAIDIYSGRGLNNKVHCVLLSSKDR